MNVSMIPTIIAIAAMIISLSGFLWTVFGAFGDLKGRVISLETKMELFWGSVQKSMGALIKQPIHFRKDELIDRFGDKNTNLSVAELCELRDILKDEMKDLEKCKNEKVLAYALYLARVEQELWERAKPKQQSWFSRLFR